MVSAFYESKLQKQRDCLIAETYKSKSFFINCHFDLVPFQSNVVSIKCRFNQMLFQSSVVSIKCRLIKCRQINFRSINCRRTEGNKVLKGLCFYRILSFIGFEKKDIRLILVCKYGWMKMCFFPKIKYLSNKVDERFFKKI